MRSDYSRKDRASLTLPLRQSSAAVDESIATKTASRSLSEGHNTHFQCVAAHPPSSHFRNNDDQPPRYHAQLSRAQSIRDALSNTTARFFGVPPPLDRQQSFAFGTSHDPRWTLRRLRYMNRRYGGINEQGLRELDVRDELTDLASQLATPSAAAAQAVTPISAVEPSVFPSSLVSRSVSIESRGSRVVPLLERRDSVAKMAWDGLSSIVHRGTFGASARRQATSPAATTRGRSPSSSFSPFSVQPTASQMTTVHEVDEENLRVAAETARESFEDATKERREEHPKTSPQSITSADSIQDEVFFDVSPVGAKPMRPTTLAFPAPTSCLFHPPSATTVDRRYFPYSGSSRLDVPCFVPCGTAPLSPSLSPSAIRDAERKLPRSKEARLQLRIRPERLPRQESFDDGAQTPIGLHEETSRGDRISAENEVTAPKKYKVPGRLQQRAELPKPPRGSSVFESICARFQARSEKVATHRRSRLFVVLLRKFLSPKFTKTVEQKSLEHPDSFHDYRPYFTYWVTCVQVLVTIITVFTYGFGPFGVGRVERTADVLHSTVTLKHVSVYELENLWLGPKFSDLVHLGATFAPCMRHDPRIYAQIEADRALENQTGCCIYNDGMGCFQTGEDTCPKVIASLAKWKAGAAGPGGRVSGAVCGQDPRYCNDPPSVDPFEWPDDITKWPQCLNPVLHIPENEKHMQCEMTGRPCCIQLHGQCRITTRDYCDFVQGYFHENATLCSQVSCLGEICGMLPFMLKDQPDQFYRLFIPIFLHAGIIHCAITVLVQWYYMRDLEKLIGWTRMAIVYMGAGIGGSLASAIFLPYRPEVGPAGSHVGIFAAMYTDIIYNWRLIQRPWSALRELTIFTVVLFICGLLPWIDNWAHLFGFIFGFLLSLATFPYIQSHNHDRTWRLMIVIACLMTALGLFVLLLAVFYLRADFDCPFCEYFNCLPFTDHLCDNQGLRLQSWLPI
uniref:Peptidase S54 rhomboid domain-containing protein n=1 Tax=Parascaris univalens TaxID=6257 RepID=A0A915BPJ5_PARUN